MSLLFLQEFAAQGIGFPYPPDIVHVKTAAHLIIYAATISPIYAVWASRLAMGYVPSTSCGYIFSLISFGMLSSSYLWEYSTLHSSVRGYSFIPDTLIFSGFSSVRCASFSLSISLPDCMPHTFAMDGIGYPCGTLIVNSFVESICAFV